MEFRLRATREQFTIMLDFMETYGDLSRIEPGAQARLINEHQWNALAELLNSVGGSGVKKPAEKWKRVWSDWKTKTKKKALLIKKEGQDSSGGPGKVRSLNALEERVLNIIGIGAITGHQEIEEDSNINSCQEYSKPVILYEENSECGQSKRDTVRSPCPTAPRKRWRRQTLLSKVTEEFIKIEGRKLRLEEKRLQKEHEREMEKLRIERLRIEMEEKRTRIFETIANTGTNIMALISKYVQDKS